MEISLHYGSGLLSLDVPQQNIAQIIRPWHDDKHHTGLTAEDVLAGLRWSRFTHIAAGRKVCILVADSTRDNPFAALYADILQGLKAAERIQFVLCTGTHNADTPGNREIAQRIRQAAESACLPDVQIHIHDFRRDKLIEAGKTERGTAIRCNAAVEDADVFLVLSDVKVHYFGGYSNPVKYFVPGICAFETAEQNHSLTLDDRSSFGRHPWHRLPERRDNPLAADQLEGMGLILRDRPVYAMTTITSAGEICLAEFGPANEVCRYIFEQADLRNSHTLEPVSNMIVSAGGLPSDTSMYIAQRALELTKSCLLDAGRILFLAACPNGFGEQQTTENFYNRLTAPLDEILQMTPDQYKLYLHKPYRFARLIKRLHSLHVKSEIPDEVLAKAHLTPANDPQSIVNDWLEDDPNAKILIIDGAAKLALYTAAATDKSVLADPG